MFKKGQGLDSRRQDGNRTKQIQWLILAQIVLATSCNAACYFSAELQGAFVTQQSTGTSIGAPNLNDNNQNIQYSQVNITEEAIPIWGHCYRRIENNVILMIGLEDEQNYCFRCIHLKLVARNVLRVRTTDKNYISKCYTNEAKAIASCPTEAILSDSRRHTEIILYKTKDFDGQDIRREYCPINGRYKLTYNVADSGDETSLENDKIECAQPDSELDNCPSGSAMNLRFRKCSFENHEITFECLGHWTEGNRKYLALLNSRTMDKLSPQYRCAIYTEESTQLQLPRPSLLASNPITIYFSNDSTCTSVRQDDNKSVATPIEHTETLQLYPVEPLHWPHTIFCSYPEWMFGHWEHMEIDQSTVEYRDHSSFKTYTMKCVENEIDSTKYLVFSRTQCGEEAYHCVWVEKRSANILEFQIGLKSSPNASMHICDQIYFDETRWLTQGRRDDDMLHPSPCPVNGEFVGLIPDATGLCAKLSSDCDTPDLMHYQVSACDYDEIFEEREYRCLGQWEEHGLVYTYTKRQDIGTYECFVGGIMSDNKIFIKEAGEYCQRHVNPYRYGMEVHKIAFCNQAPIGTIDGRLTDYSRTNYSAVDFAQNDTVPDETPNAYKETVTSFVSTPSPPSTFINKINRAQQNEYSVMSNVAQQPSQQATDAMPRATQPPPTHSAATHPPEVTSTRSSTNKHKTIVASSGRAPSVTKWTTLCVIITLMFKHHFTTLCTSYSS